MMPTIRFAIVAAVLLGLSAGVAAAQQTAPTAPKPNIPVKVDVVLSRYQGEKKTSSLPFSMWLDVPWGPQPAYTSVRMGVDVPVGKKVTTSSRMNGAPAENRTTTTTSGTDSSTEYRYVGTSIDCRVSQPADGRLTVDINVQDSSIYTADGPGRGAQRISDPVAFRTFQMSNRLPMRDGQTLQYAMATDKISGDTLKVDVTLNILK
jgi:hypothetical protein